MSTENIGVAKKAKPNLRKTKIILEKNRKIKILGGFVNFGNGRYGRKKIIFFIGWNVCWYCLFMVYLFFLFVGQGGKKKKVYIDYNKESIKQFFK